MLSLSLTQSLVVPAAILLDGWRGVTLRIWHYLDDPHQIGNLKVSVTSLLGGALIVAIALFLSRTLSTLLARRIAKKAYLDPGLRYTLGRLTQVTDALNQITSHTYDEVDSRLTQTDAKTHTTAFEYDKLGRRTKRTLKGTSIFSASRLGMW